MSIHFIVIPLPLVALSLWPLVQTLSVFEIVHIVAHIHAAALVGVGALAVAVSFFEEAVVTVTPALPVLGALTVRFAVLHLAFVDGLLDSGALFFGGELCFFGTHLLLVSFVVDRDAFDQSITTQERVGAIREEINGFEKQRLITVQHRD